MVRQQQGGAGVGHAAGTFDAVEDRGDGLAIQRTTGSAAPAIRRSG